MNEGWLPRAWGDESGDRLPQLEDLPLAEQGYDPQAVEEAFQAFYRHAAQLDATLRLLESMETFQRQARELRADIRALRAASWGPVPVRSGWTDAYRATSYRVSSGASGGIAGSWPRLALEAAFILLVAAGAALAELRTAIVVLLVLGAWLLVGLAELVASAVRVRVPSASTPTPAVQERPGLEGPAEQAEPEPEPEPVLLGEDTAPDLVPVEEPEPVDEPAPVEEPTPVEAGQHEPEETEPEPIVITIEPKRRFWRRRRDEGEPAAPPFADAKHVRVLPARSAPLTADPWERGPELPLDEPDQPDEPEELAEPTAEEERAPEPVPVELEGPLERPSATRIRPALRLEHSRLRRGRR